MNRSAAHTRLCNAILAALGALPGVVIGLNPSGNAMYTGETGNVWRVPYGWPSHEGGPDLVAVVAPLGRMVALEAKTGKATTTAEQKAVHAALRQVGVIVEVVRSVDEARTVITKAMGVSR